MLLTRVSRFPLRTSCVLVSQTSVSILSSYNALPGRIHPHTIRYVFGTLLVGIMRERKAFSGHFHLIHPCTNIMNGVVSSTQAIGIAG